MTVYIWKDPISGVLMFLNYFSYELPLVRIALHCIFKMDEIYYMESNHHYNWLKLK